MFIIDRFEGEYALIEINRKIFHIPKTLLPKDAREGDVIVLNITVDKKATEKKKKSMGKLADSIFED